MTDGMYSLTTLHHLVDHDARKLFSAEVQLQNILPDWITKAGTLALKNDLQLYFNIVKQHIGQLGNFLEEEDIQKLSRTNAVMQAHITEAREQLCNCMDARIVDASLLASVQGINHYKIGMYGTAAAFSRSLGNMKAASLFHNALINEKDMDIRLSKLAEDEINARATAPVALPEAGKFIS